MTDDFGSWASQDSRINDLTEKTAMEEAHLRRVHEDSFEARRTSKQYEGLPSSIITTELMPLYFNARAGREGKETFGWNDMVDFSQRDVDNLSKQIYDENGKRDYEKSERKFYDLYENDEDFKKIFDKKESELRSYNNKISRNLSNGKYPQLYRGTTLQDIINLLKPRLDDDGWDDYSRPAQRVQKKDRKNPIYDFLATSINPTVAMGDGETFAYGGIAIEFGTEALKKNVKGGLNPTEYTLFPSPMVGQHIAIKRSIVNMENVDSDYPARMAHEMEVRIPIGTELNNAVEGIVVDLTKIGYLHFMDELFPKSDKKFNEIRGVIDRMASSSRSSGDWSVYLEELIDAKVKPYNFQQHYEDDESLRFINEPQTIPQFISSRLHDILGFDKIRENNKGEKVPRIRFKTSKWNGSADYLTENGKVNLKDEFELRLDRRKRHG